MCVCVCVCACYSCQTVKTKEEKEVLEHFAGVVSEFIAISSTIHSMQVQCTCNL